MNVTLSNRQPITDHSSDRHRSERPRAGGGACSGRDIRVRPSCPRAASDCVGRSRNRRFVDPGASAPVRRARAPVGGTISRSHNICVCVYCSSVPGRYRLCCRAPPPWRPATPPGRPARRRRGHLPRWTRPEPKRRGVLFRLAPGRRKLFLQSAWGGRESSPWSTQSSVLQGDSVCAVGCVGSALDPRCCLLVGGVGGRVDCQVCCTSGR